MPTTVSETTVIDPADLARLDDALAFVRGNDTGSIFAALLPGITEDEHAVMVRAFRFQHAAVLLFPPSLQALIDELGDRGLEVTGVRSSVVVRDRLSRRYRVPAHALDVSIVRASVGAAEFDGRELEIFVLPAAGEEVEPIAAGEREHEDEAHLALELLEPNPVLVHALRSMLLDGGAMRPDGGGYNRGERGTVLYFRDPDAPHRLLRRLELSVPGQHHRIVDAHTRQSQPPANRLLELMTGAWRTQAIAVAAELHLADHLASLAHPTVADLAAATGSDSDALGRLLRYLASLGLVTADGERFSLTEVGRLLRTDADTSLRPLALLYGGPFYESFGHLEHAVRTGGDAFEHAFGQHHFEYFAARPALAELFDQAMASSASMFGSVAELVDFSLAGTVVDVGGGNGELLLRVLRAAPNARGVLLERSHAVETARSAMQAAGCADRCEFVIGDFTESIPAGGDIYILSRVLHDWDDDRCRTILRRCAEAMTPSAALLVVERLLPEDGAPSLAFAWDIHMLCNVGGRERTRSHFAELFAEAGFRLTASFDLPLDMAVMTVAKRDEAMA